MKKIAIGVLYIVLAFMLIACGKENPTPQPTENTVVQNDTQTVSKTVDPSLVGKSFVCGDYEYTIQENGTVYISGYIGSDTDLILPTELDGYAVSGVADEGFYSAESIEALLIPGTIREIGKEAFAGCTNLKKVVIEEGVEIIGYRAFQNGINNSSIVSEAIIPDSIIKMGDRPFGLTNEVSHESNGLLYIGKFVVGTSDSFDGHVVFDKEVLGIADEAFFNWGGWAAVITDTSIEIPEGVRYIGKAAFAGQDSIDYFKVPATVEEIGSCAMLYDYVNNGYELYYSHDTQKIYGKAGSVAEQYADINGLNFVIENG